MDKMLKKNNLGIFANSLNLDLKIIFLPIKKSSSKLGYGNLLR